MLNHINISGVFVLDQDEALDFYVNKLGLEVGNDVDLGFMRWLTVRVPGDPNREILLEKPGPPSMDDNAGRSDPGADQQGSVGFHRRLHDRRLPQDLRNAGASAASRSHRSRPTRDYGTDIGVRDPFGNHIRIVQPVGG